MTKDQLGHSISNPAKECAFQLDKTAHSWNTKNSLSTIDHFLMMWIQMY